MKCSDKGGYTFLFCAIELLFSHDEIISRFKKEKKERVLKMILLKYEDKELYEEYFGFFGKMTTAFVANQYLNNVNL